MSVRGYYRKDGTYVRGYTRSSPSGGGYSGGSSGYIGSSTSTYSSLAAPSFGARAVTTSNLNLRQSATTTSRVIKQLPRGSMVTIQSCTGGWCRVDYGRLYGFVSQNFLQVITSQAPRPVVSASPSNVYYSRCAEAKAAGAAPLFRGQPGYRAGLDGDGDGIACE
ncbi:excalibur calcium-binding domain-containing protein [Deinococcus sp. 12RED42]|uniref:excalibur calcium-binding domain-containing protein n=1 Tax=Deinococcus sp. 12RED42 TaxID=2745872 RepID=UPI00351CCD1E